MIRLEEEKDRQTVGWLIKNFPDNNHWTGTMRGSDKVIKELSLVSESENGTVNGYISCVKVKSGEYSTPLITGIHADSDDKKSALLAELKITAEKLGYNALLAYPDNTELFKKEGFRESIACGFIPPEDHKNIGRMYCFELTTNKYGRLEIACFPEELGKKGGPVFNIYTEMSDEEYRFAAIDTRAVSRLRTYIFCGTVIVVFILLFIAEKHRVFLAPAVLAALYMGKILSDLKKFKEKMGESKGKPMIEHELFFEDRLLVYFPGSMKAKYYEYGYFHYLYLKKGYMFLGTPTRNGFLDGFFIKDRSDEERKALVKFLKKKTGGIGIRR
ncbi:hypothetical protein [Ruminococcus flavefaciens]|uniref:Uncharacterized protein n=1 Tax=Ruminococcus flavefaciens 007c TaxID=1341157 RepID=W7V047_RUMFL|nr:hypothetical protein [Ruminococcus flavefaciens]EWM54405.1 hypothetical protein RF007C_12410 [Ruminococcus flavefaciens 007c]